MKSIPNNQQPDDLQAHKRKTRPALTQIQQQFSSVDFSQINRSLVRHDARVQYHPKAVLYVLFVKVSLTLYLDVDETEQNEFYAENFVSCSLRRIVVFDEQQQQFDSNPHWPEEYVRKNKSNSENGREILD
jgi:hypothetical protein